MTVFCPQIQTYWDKDTGKRVNSYQLPPSKKFGEIVKILPNGLKPTELDFIIPSLTSAFKNYNDNNDYLTFSGHPAIVALTFAAVSHFNRGKFSFLQWDNEDKSFVPAHIDFNKGD